MSQTYANYYRDYLKTPSGRAAKHRAQKKYRDKLRAMYATGYEKARLLHKERINR